MIFQFVSLSMRNVHCTSVFVIKIIRTSRVICCFIGNVVLSCSSLSRYSCTTVFASISVLIYQKPLILYAYLLFIRHFFFYIFIFLSLAYITLSDFSSLFFFLFMMLLYNLKYYRLYNFYSMIGTIFSLLIFTSLTINDLMFVSINYLTCKS